MQSLLAAAAVPSNRVIAAWISFWILLSTPHGVEGSSSKRATSSSGGTWKNNHADDDDCHCADDFVSRLPGLDQPLPSPWYSGFVSYPLQGHTIHTHYVLVKAEQEMHDDKANPNKKKQKPPLIYWSNGGPGASSLFGLLTELGPLLLSDDSLRTADYAKTGIPTPLYNPNAWTRLGHVLLFDQPAPVGFSYCDDDIHNSTSCLSWTDELAAANAHAALTAFYKDKFPCLLHHDLYLTGESYGGIYIPTLARRLLQAQQQTQEKQARQARNAQQQQQIRSLSESQAQQPQQQQPQLPKLKGFAVGDGCLGTETGICGVLNDSAEPGFNVFHVLFLFGHDQIPLKTFHQVMRSCRPSSSPDMITSNWLAADTPECQAALAKVQEQAGGYYEYNLYDDCTYRNGILASFLLEQQKQQQKGQNHAAAAADTTTMTGEMLPPKLPQLPLQGAVNDYPCGGDLVLEQYLSLPTVREALHVPDNYFSVDNAQDFDYTPTEKDLRGFYRDLTQQNRQHIDPDKVVRILIYNGDADPAITSLAAQNWTSHLPLPELESWRPWTVDHCLRVGGYVTRYDGNLDFLTIRGAGHMVPTYKSDATFAFMSAWINNEDYPIYDKSCKSPPPPQKPSWPQQQERFRSLDGHQPIMDDV